MSTLGIYLKHLGRGKAGAACVAALSACGAAACAQPSPIVNTTWSSPTPTSLQAAGRILNQATFGPTINDVFNVEALGVSKWVDQQLATPAYQMPLANPNAVTSGDCGLISCTVEYYWWNDVLFGQDQLRQRVAFELSKHFVVSYDQVDPRYVPNFLNVLANDAFGNWYTLMRDVALSPAMGTYLNMANSSAPAAGQRANENFGREMMQLFSLGTVQLRQDGSQVLDGGGRPVPNYTSDQVQNFSLAYTGWTFANNDCSAPSSPLYYNYSYPPGQNCSMTALPGAHSQVAKTLLRGTVLAAGQSALQDLDGALQNLFNDPSLPPFVCRRLIESLVKSNPSPAYISRVAGVFINNGAGVRGDMPSVLRAILLDPEARAADNVASASDPNGGKLRDPILLWTSVLRAVGATSSAGLPNVGVYDQRFNLWLKDLDERPHDEPSVFSFYSPDFQVGGLYAPEFQNENVYTIAQMESHMESVVENNWALTGVGATEINVDFGPNSLWYRVLAQNGPTNYVNVLDALLMHGTMRVDMQQAIVNALRYMDVKTGTKAAFYLIVTSPQYRVMM